MHKYMDDSLKYKNWKSMESKINSGILYTSDGNKLLIFCGSNSKKNFFISSKWRNRSKCEVNERLRRKMEVNA